MSWNMKSGGGDFDNPKPGVYPMRCYMVAQIGTHHNVYEGKENIRFQVVLGFELPTSLIKTGELEGLPHGLSIFYTMSLGRNSNLLRDLQIWKGKNFTSQQQKDSFQLPSMIGLCCFGQVKENDNGKMIISAIMQLPEGTEVPKSVNKPIIFDLEDYLAGDETVYQRLPNWIKEKYIAECDEVKQRLLNSGTAGGASEDDGFDDDGQDSSVPF